MTGGVGWKFTLDRRTPLVPRIIYMIHPTLSAEAAVAPARLPAI